MVQGKKQLNKKTTPKNKLYTLLPELWENEEQ